jgi:acyl carrier protein phosphodiesterase
MNFLAHAYLSGDRNELLTGNMITDFIKGGNITAFSPGIQEGIFLHRQIDLFTDTHPLVKECRRLFSPVIRHYAMVIVDVVFDHFLAKNWNMYHPLPLRTFTQETYRRLDRYSDIFPERFQYVFPRMRANDWLYGYSEEEGLFGSFRGLSYRSPGFQFAEETVELFLMHREELERRFHLFFPELIEHCRK